MWTNHGVSTGAINRVKINKLDQWKQNGPKCLIFDCAAGFIIVVRYFSTFLSTSCGVHKREVIEAVGCVGGRARKLVGRTLVTCGGKSMRDFLRKQTKPVVIIEAEGNQNVKNSQ